MAIQQIKSLFGVKVEEAPSVEDGSLLLATVHGEPVQRFSSEVVTSLRHMLTRLMREDDLPKSLSVVSALREEGVTYTTLAMASTLAHDTQSRVCVVDLNWWWPNERVQPLVQGSRGLAGIIRDEVSLDDVLVPTADPRLTLLPAGYVPFEQRPIMARRSELKDLLTELEERFDHLILDVPAILQTSDAIPLASLGTACCVVIRQGASLPMAVARALDEISHLAVLGVVMNRVHISTPSWILQWIPQN